MIYKYMFWYNTKIEPKRIFKRFPHLYIQTHSLMIQYIFWPPSFSITTLIFMHKLFDFFFFFVKWCRNDPHFFYMIINVLGTGSHQLSPHINERKKNIFKFQYVRIKSGMHYVNCNWISFKRINYFMCVLKKDILLLYSWWC